MSSGTAQVTYTRTLQLFAKHERSTQVCCSIETVTEGVPGVGRQVTTADEYLDTLLAQGLTQSVALLRQWTVAM